MPFAVGLGAFVLASATITSILLGRTAWTYADGTAPDWFAALMLALFYLSALLGIAGVFFGVRRRGANGDRPSRETYAIALGALALVELAAFVVVSSQTRVLE
jgi:hypothetical protein